MLRKIRLFILLLTCNILPQEFPDTAETAYYYNIVHSDSSYYILSNKGVLKINLITSNPLKFRFVDEIKGNFIPQSLIAVNRNRLLIKNSDTLSLYNINPDGKLSLARKQNDAWSIDLIEPFNYDFIIKSGTLLKLLGCNDDSLYIKDDSVAVYSGQKISYPYFCKQGEIYKYVEGFGYYLVFTYMNSREEPSTFQNRISYRTWVQPNINMPPSEASLISRALVEPDFPIVMNRHYWSYNVNGGGFLGGGNLRVTSRYVELTRYDWATQRVFDDQIHNIDALRYASDFADSTNFIPFDYCLFLLTRTRIAVSISDSAHLGPLIFYRDEMSGVQEDENIASDDFTLYQNFPNPFNPVTTIKYNVKQFSRVTISIYDCIGNLAELLTDEMKIPGEYSIPFNADNLATGVYFCVMTTPSTRQVKKLVFIK